MDWNIRLIFKLLAMVASLLGLVTTQGSPQQQLVVLQCMQLCITKYLKIKVAEQKVQVPPSRGPGIIILYQHL